MQQLELVPYLLYEKEDNGILWIKFNRPEMLNAAVGGAERNRHAGQGRRVHARRRR